MDKLLQNRRSVKEFLKKKFLDYSSDGETLNTLDMEDWIYTCYPNEKPTNISNMASLLLSEKNDSKKYTMYDLLRNYELGLKENAAAMFLELKMLGFEDDYPRYLEIEKWKLDKT
eukprot:UN07436